MMGYDVNCRSITVERQPHPHSHPLLGLDGVGDGNDTHILLSSVDVMWNLLSNPKKIDGVALFLTPLGEDLRQIDTAPGKCDAAVHVVAPFPFPTPPPPPSGPFPPILLSSRDTLCLLL